MKTLAFSILLLAVLGLSAGANAQDSLNVSRVWQTPIMPTVNAVAVAGNYAYVVTSGLGLCVFNIANPAAPVFMGYCVVQGNAYGVAVSGNYAYVSDGGTRLNVINITNPSAPAIVSFLSCTGNARGVAISGNYLYLADGASGLRVINITNPLAPELSASLNILASSSCYSVTVSGNYAYVGSTGGMQVVNVEYPTYPWPLGSAQGNGTIYGVAVAGNFAYAADSYGLYVIYIANPAMPVPCAAFSLGTTAYGISVTGDYAYVADGANGLGVINTSNPLVPAVAGYYNTSGESRGVVVSGIYAYVADGYYFGIYNISRFVSPPRTPDSLVIQYLQQTQRMQLNWARVLTDTSNNPISISRYTIYRSASPDSVQWDSVGAPVPPDTTMFVDSTATGVNGFYRVKAIK
jgi:hypothetical protein